MSASSLHLTSESVTEGHPDKMCDQISDAVLDAIYKDDPMGRVACETAVTTGLVMVMGEITTSTYVDIPTITREVVRDIGYVNAHYGFDYETCGVAVSVKEQSGDIAMGVDTGGAGDQGIMFGYATDETPELMPLPISLAHGLSRRIAAARKNGERAWLRPDAKTQVSVEYDASGPVAVKTVLVSTMHTADASHEEIRDYVASCLAPEVLGAWYNPEVEVLVNPTGQFIEGGPSADAGVTGRKIIVDTYGGMGRHGGGAFSGKDPSKVDRSGAYFCRYVARQVVTQGIAKRAEVQVSYAIGRAEPTSVLVNTFGTGVAGAAEALVRGFDFRPRAIIEQLDLLKPIYRQTTNYGHFGKRGLPWEA
jgi:S-adenosylmethionine synthetase